MTRKISHNTRRNTQPLLLCVAIACSAVLGCSPQTTALNFVDRAPYDPTIAVKEVLWNEGRVKRDPKGAIEWSQLSGTYLTLSRQTDDNALAVKAEDAARKSLDLRRRNNSNAAVRLAKAILEQHRFHDALVADEDALKINPNDSGAKELHAEILCELGRYDDAEKVVEENHLASFGLSGLALKARLLEIDGKPDEAEIILRQAIDQADKDWDMPREANAWFHLKLGTLLCDQGKNDEAEDQFKIAIDTNPRDFKSMGALARIEAAKGDLPQAEMWGEKSVAIQPSVEVASLLEDIAASQQDPDGEAKYATIVDQVSHPGLYAFLKDPYKVPAKNAKPHTHDRLYATYCADHKRNLADALIAAEKDLAERKDIYAFDTLAWVHHQMGRDKEAKSGMAKALGRGTHDAKMLYHAGMIDAALGNRTLATDELRRALRINPQFQFIHQDIAKSALSQLQGAIR